LLIYFSCFFFVSFLFYFFLICRLLRITMFLNRTRDRSVSVQAMIGTGVQISDPNFRVPSACSWNHTCHNNELPGTGRPALD
jgi:hypothetical protein